MDSKGYLESYGWKHGEALKKGGIKKPILVKHKKDKKGIGHVANGSADAWWERLFDGQLKGLDVSNHTTNGVTFKQEKVIATAVRKEDSPLYRMFVRGETLQGTTGKVSLSKSVIKQDGATNIIESLKTSFKDGNELSTSSSSIPSDCTLENKKKSKSESKSRTKDKKKDVLKDGKNGSTVSSEKTLKKEKKEKKDKKDKKEKKDKKSKEKSKKKSDESSGEKKSSKKRKRDEVKSEKSKKPKSK